MAELHSTLYTVKRVKLGSLRQNGDSHGSESYSPQGFGNTAGLLKRKEDVCTKAGHLRPAESQVGTQHSPLVDASYCRGYERDGTALHEMKT